MYRTLKVLNKNTKKAQALISSFNTARKKGKLTIRHLYKNPSIYKVSAYNELEKIYKDFGTCINGNSQTFTYGGIDTKTNTLHYYTSLYEYVIAL